MDLSWDHFNFSLQAKTHIWPQKQQFGYVGFQDKIRHNPTLTNQNRVQFQKAQLIPYKTRYAFSHSPPGQGVMSTTYSLSLSLEWSQVTHIPASLKTDRPYKPEK